MPKALCIISIALSGLLLLLFLLDILLGIPFGKHGGIIMNLGFMLASGIVLTFGILTFREQR